MSSELQLQILKEVENKLGEHFDNHVVVVSTQWDIHDGEHDSDKGDTIRTRYNGSWATVAGLIEFARQEHQQELFQNKTEREE